MIMIKVEKSRQLLTSFSERTILLITILVKQICFNCALAACMEAQFGLEEAANNIKIGRAQDVSLKHGTLLLRFT